MKLEYRSAKFSFALFDSNKRSISGDESYWELDIHQDMIDTGLNCESNDNESERFGFAFRELFKKPENRFGDGYFNSMLLGYVHISRTAGYDKAKEIIGAIHQNQPDMEGGTVPMIVRT